MLLEVVMILGLGVVVLTVEVKFDVVRIDVLMGMGRAGRKILIGDGVPEALTVMPGDWRAKLILLVRSQRQTQEPGTGGRHCQRIIMNP